MNFLSSASSTDNQTFLLIVFSVLLVLLLSSLIVFTYEKTSREVVAPDHFIQSLILMSIVTATIMQSIGDSMARGFGIFGALAILRFRTNIGNPRNIAFIFAAMAVGIACGVYSFLNAIIGTLAFCLIAVLLSLTPFSRKNKLLGQLRLQLPADSSRLAEIEAVLSRRCQASVLKRYRVVFGENDSESVEYTYEVHLKEELNGAALAREIRAVPDTFDVRLIFNDVYASQND